MSPQLPSLLVAILVAGLAWYLCGLIRSAAVGYHRAFHTNARRNLGDLFLFVDTRRLFQLNCGVILIVFALSLVWSGNPVVALIGAIAAGASPPLVYRWLKHRRQDRIVNDLPDTLMAIATSMRSGLSLNQSLETVIANDDGPLAQELELVLRELRVGSDYDEALKGLYSRIPVVEIQLLVSAMKISKEIGGNLSEALERMSSTLRSRLQMEGKIKSLTAQGRLQGIVMTGLPIFLIIVLFQMEPYAMSFLFDTWYGWAVVAVIVVLLAIGYSIIRKIVNIDV
jgi:tight adherence protein B